MKKVKMIPLAETHIELVRSWRNSKEVSDICIQIIISQKKIKSVGLK